jgi:prepilin-type N-terminal cleavage/methylation domain-containing protein
MRVWRNRRLVRSDDSGFSLIEVIVALGLLAIVMAAASTLFIRSLAQDKQQQQRQVASQLADQGIQLVRSHDPKTILNGRTQAQIDAQWASPGPIVLSQSTKPTAVGSGTAIIPTTPTTVVAGGTKYSVNTIIGICYAGTTGTSNCVATGTTGKLYRVAVSVTWNGAHGNGCSAGTCSVVADTLIDPSVDPTFNNS